VRSPWLYIQSEALQDIAFHLPGPSPAPAARESPVLGRTGEEGRTTIRRYEHWAPRANLMPCGALSRC
jgi:hypothetical protein